MYDAYAYKLGLGQRTGVEVGEAVGRLTTKMCIRDRWTTVWLTSRWKAGRKRPKFWR